MKWKRSKYNLLGLKFGRLTVLARDGSKQQGAMWLCECECGATVSRLGRNLRRNFTKSCGCYGREQKLKAITKHGLSKTSIHKRWTMIKQRVSNPNHPSFKNYGGRGITMHLPWMRSVECFARDIPPKPDGNLTIDRIDNDGNYEPGNIRWATKAQQCRNKRGNHWITVDGVTRVITDWAKLFSIAAPSIYNMAKKLGTDEQAVRHFMEKKGIAA